MTAWVADSNQIPSKLASQPDRERRRLAGVAS
jgi:hypothetical protein